MDQEALNKATALTAKFEGCHTIKADGMVYPYICPAGYPTQGYGEVVKGMDVPAITKEEASSRLTMLLKKFHRGMYALTKVPVNENQQAALTSFCFNVGLGNYRSSTLRMKLNRGDYAEAGEQFQKWNKAGGRILRGLTRRRLAERQLFLSEQ